MSNINRPHFAKFWFSTLIQVLYVHPQYPYYPSLLYRRDPAGNPPRLDTLADGPDEMFSNMIPEKDPGSKKYSMQQFPGTIALLAVRTPSHPTCVPSPQFISDDPW